VAADTGEPWHRVLVRLGRLGEPELATALSEALRLPLARPSAFPVLPVPDLPLRPRFLVEHRILPLAADAARVTVALADPLDAYARQAVALATGKAVEVKVGVPAELEAALRELYGDEEMAPGGAGTEGGDGVLHDEDVERLRDQASEAPVVQLVHRLLARAVDARASDLHLEAEAGGGLRVRHRVDGQLEEADAVPAGLRAAAISRVKILAGLDIAERRLPQDGRIALTARGRTIDLRVSTIPFHPGGEGVVLRLLDRAAVALALVPLGFADEALARYRRLLREPNGIVLVTGPSGSGKTSTLYASLLELKSPATKIVTVEDPVEYQLEAT
jgi:general secretion pathway protein E